MVSAEERAPGRSPPNAIGSAASSDSSRPSKSECSSAVTGATSVVVTSAL